MRKFLICLLTATYLLSGCSNHSITGPGMPTDKTSQFHEAIERVAESLATAESSQSQERISTFTTWNGQETVPVYSGEPYAELNGNIPYFTDREKTEDVFEKFRRRILVTSVVSKTPQMPKVGIFIHGMDGFANILPE
mgnify:CR=1 FL=1